MKNLSSKLEYLFRQYLIRKEKEKEDTSIKVYNYSAGNNNWLNQDDRYDGVIYFYEWSDVNNGPKMFYNLGAFDSFLRRCGIFMAPYQKDIIYKLDRAYITCKKGTHDLLIRGTRQLLVDAVSDNAAQGLDIHTVGSVITNLPAPVVGGGFNNISGIRRPPMYDDYSGEWYG